MDTCMHTYIYMESSPRKMWWTVLSGHGGPKIFTCPSRGGGGGGGEVSQTRGLNSFTLNFFGGQQGFLNLEGGGGEMREVSPPLAKNVLIPPLPGKVPPVD